MLEDRRLLSVTMNPIVGPESNSAFVAPAGKDLYVPVIGSDSGQTISYAATSSDPQVRVSVLTGNPTLELTVHGTDSGGNTFSGTMTFQLFANIAPQTVQGIINEVDAGLYNGSSFYRMETSSTFQLIQGGIEKTSGKSDTTTLPDEFNVAAAFNSSGLLAMANAGAGTATSEFFITGPNRPLADDPQSLNFGYTIFGQILTGLNIYNDILNVPTTSSGGINFANTPVTIDSAAIVTDTQNAVLQISEPNDFTGNSTITVTGTGSDSTTAQQSFTVSVAAPSATSPPPLSLNPVSNLTTAENQAASFQLSAADSFGGTPTFSVTGATSFTATPQNVTVQVTPGSVGNATVTLTPASGFTGIISLVAHANDGTYSVNDAQAFTLTVASPVEILSITQPINAANANSLTVSGLGLAAASISLVASDSTNVTSPFTTTVGSDGTWSISGVNISALADGTITFTVSSTDAGGAPVQASSTAVKDTVAPNLAVVNTTNPINGGNAHTVTLSGTGEVGAAISIIAGDGTNSTTPVTTTIDGSGNWSVTGIDTGALVDGSITFLTTATDAAGNSTHVSTTAIKDTVAPAVALTSATDPINIDNSGAITASGTGDVGATISVVATDGIHSSVAVTTTVGAEGTWNVSGIDVSPLNDGAITYVATASDAAGNSRQSSLAAVKHTVAITVFTDPVNAANAGSTSASGTGEVGATISLVVTDGVVTTAPHTTTVAGDGTWSLAAIDVGSLADGNITFTATATNALGHSAQTSKTVNKDILAPAVAISSVTDPINVANRTSTVIAGSSEAGATISVVASDGTNSTTAMTTTAGSSGTWNLSGIDVSALADGTITYTVSATDTAGNSANATRTATKDTVAPNIALTTVTDPIGLANYHSVTASGTGEVGASVSVVVSDGTATATSVSVTVGPDGTWSVGGIDLGGLLDGTVTYTATATDSALNTSQSGTSATKATVRVTSLTNPINLSNVSSLSASGTGQIGATISLVATDGTNTTAASATTIGADGTWSISGIDASALIDGTVTFTATASDGQGNSAQNSLTATKNTASPSVAITFVTNPIDPSNNAAVSASGTGSAGSQIALIASDGTNSTTSYSTVVASDGTWQIDNIDVVGLSDGTITFTATITDGTGHTAQGTMTATKTSVVANSLSGRVFIDTIGNGRFDSSESVLTAVTLTLNGVDAQGKPIPSQTTTTAGDGTYSFSDLAPGTYSITEAQPAKIADGSAIVGSLGGSAGVNTIGGIVMSAGGAGTDYDFSERGLDISMVSARLFLASAPPVQQTLNNTVSQYGAAAPMVSSISQADANPTTATSVTYTVNFSESVSGVDAADFSVYGISGASIESVTGSDSAYTVTEATGGGFGSLGISLVDNDSIVSQQGAPLGGAGAGNGNFTGPTYAVTSQTVSVAVTTVTNPINAADQNDVTANGTGEVGATISLVASDGTNSTTALTTTVASDGTWAITGIGAGTLADGTITFTASATDAQGGTGQNSLTATKDSVAPAVVISGVTHPINSGNANDITASGTGEVGATISLVASDGSWSIAGNDVSTLADGTITFTATATDAAGNTGHASTTATKDILGPAIAVTQVTNPITIANEHATQASGTGEVGAGVSLVVTDGTTSSTPYTTTVAGDGTWSISGIDVSDVVDGTIAFTVTATDAAGNTTETSLTATKATVVLVSVTNPINAANQSNVTASGTGEVGATISLVASNGANSTSALTTTVASDGTWAINGIDTSALADGTVTFTATATDPLENTAQSSRSATKLTVA